MPPELQKLGAPGWNRTIFSTLPKSCTTNVLQGHIFNIDRRSISRSTSRTQLHPTRIILRGAFHEYSIGPVRRNLAAPVGIEPTNLASEASMSTTPSKGNCKSGRGAENRTLEPLYKSWRGCKESNLNTLGQSQIPCH